MRIILALASLAVATTAIADQRQRPTFMATTAYERCQTTYAFACGRGQGAHRYGTAHESKICERYVFLPDGTYTSTTASLPQHHEGTYRIFAGKVRLVPDDAEPFELALSFDGTKLGDMKRLPPK